MGKEKLDLTRLSGYIEELIGCEALEICHFPEHAPGEIYIPYMMNDALEYFIVLHDSVITGPDNFDRKDHTIEAWDREILSDFSEHSSCEFVSEEKRTGMILKDPGSKSFVIWFQCAELYYNYYQYHRIGHFWKKGMEQWRILVYMIGTVFDKYTFIGESAVNEDEREFLSLITFAPFRHWTPVSEEYESEYPDSHAGILTMKKFAKMSGDEKYLRWLCLYEKGCTFLPMEKINLFMAKLLTKPERGPLYGKILDHVMKASEKYPERHYGSPADREIEEKRIFTDETLKAKGFEGEYPFYKRRNTDQSFEQVIAMEQHPFTFSALDYEDFDFEIKYMYSKTPEEQSYPCAGFFAGKGNTGRILSDLSSL